MSFNIRYGTANDGENAWPLRRELVAEVVRDFDAEVVGLQEALHFQLQELESRLPGYGWEGVGRDDGREAGEYAAILYREDRMELLAEGTFWFSDTPEVPGSMSWGNEIPRICTWVRLRPREGGGEFTLLNVHWDHQSQPSRERAAALLLERMRSMGGEGQLMVVTGDFNAGEGNPAFRALLTSSDVPLRDSFRGLHPDSSEVGTYHGFRGGTEGEKIDAVLMGPGWGAAEAGIIRTRHEGRYPSDHYPVTAVLGWPGILAIGGRNGAHENPDGRFRPEGR